MSAYIHETAVVDMGAAIGEGAKIWHFCHVSARSVIGSNCVLGQNVFVADDVILGNNVKVQNNVSLYTGVVCDDDVFLGPSMVFTNVMNPRSHVNRKNEFRQTHVKKGASVGANATVICGVSLGCYCMVGAGAVVTRNVPDYALVAGVPARWKGWVSRAGQKLDFADNNTAVCSQTGEKYRLCNGKVERVED